MITAHRVPQRRTTSKPRAFVYESGSTTTLVCEFDGGVWTALYGLSTVTKRRLELPACFTLKQDVRDALDALTHDEEG